MRCQVLLEAVNTVIWEETKFALVQAMSTIAVDVSQRMFALSVGHHVDVSWELATHVTCTVTVNWKHTIHLISYIRLNDWKTMKWDSASHIIYLCLWILVNFYHFLQHIFVTLPEIILHLEVLDFINQFLRYVSLFILFPHVKYCYYFIVDHWICPFSHLSVNLSIFPSFSEFVHFPIFQWICPFTHLSVSLFIYLSFNEYVRLFIHLLVSLSIYSRTCLQRPPRRATTCYVLTVFRCPDHFSTEMFLRWVATWWTRTRIAIFCYFSLATVDS